MNLHRIDRNLGVRHYSVTNWTKAHAEKLLEAPVPEKVEMWKWMSYSHLLARKKGIYIIAMVDRKTRCILGQVVVWERTQEAIQLLVNDTPKAK